jgi:NlpC/P60 family
MKSLRTSFRIMSLLAVSVCTIAGFTAASPSVTQIINLPTDQTIMLKLGPQPPTSRLDCTHWVHALYERAGLHYPYATSRNLYKGIKEFQQVLSPKSGDLIVWRGHAGIILDPSQGKFLSALRRGIKISSYMSSYWEQRGSPRFFRYARSVERSETSGRNGDPVSGAVSSPGTGG